MDLIDLARLEESRHAQALSEAAPESRAFGGGVAARGHPGSWVNAAVGAGLAGPIPRSELEDLVRWYESAGIETRLELSPFTDRNVLAECAAMAFVLRGFETVFFRGLDPGLLVEPVQPPPPGLIIEPVDTGDDEALFAYVRVAMSGFYPEGAGPSEEEVRVTAGFARHPRSVCLTAMLDGRIVGAAGCEVVEGRIAALFGASVLPAYRRRGIQQALLAARLNLAMQRGCRVATIGSRPGAPTERNVRRLGFQVGYSKVMLCRPGAGLTPGPGIE